MSRLSEQWQMTLNPTSLREGRIDVWRVFLERDQTTLNTWFEFLSDDEKRKADRYIFASDREHYIAGRGALRKIIGGYLGLAPENVSFSYNRFGKPRLSREDGGLRFNISHSRGIGVIAVTQNREVGIDIEYVNYDFDVLSVAASAFSAEDAEHLRLLPETLRTAAFFAGWTRKEAFLKAMGDGLSSSPERQAAVSMLTDEQEVSFICTPGEKVTRWTLTSVMIDDDYKAALAVGGMMETVRYWRLEGDRA